MLVNHLGLFSSILGAKFVFKLFQNFALKIILQNEGFELKLTLILAFKIYQEFGFGHKIKVVDIEKWNKFHFYTNL